MPSILNYMVSHPAFTKENFAHLETIISGAASVPATSVEAVSNVLENVTFQNGKYFEKFVFNGGRI